ncbi:hypothetical protein N7481_008840 [Penicillium waksmanii]|uniref:uncharacterized protein n=1 Tax=Penicillium waksmanii TaxID=69791 RepID=UPI00254951AE|nr:uncharacterized protein N7481_008840 [Penicillium waksmanii]KAJ5975133.1 hypothetical protein N7481_008840 [Penicillium waksmanii]
MDPRPGIDSRADSSVMLPSGQLVCGPHRLVVCSLCHEDHILPEQTSLRRNGLSNAPIRCLGYRPTAKLILPETFVPPNQEDTPETLFKAQHVSMSPPIVRNVRQSINEQHLIYIAGVCPGNGQTNPKAGCAYVFAPVLKRIVRPYAYVSFRLENKGPTGEYHSQTKERADLRAVIGALRFRCWKGMENCSSLVIATDSTYVVEGITSWVIDWLNNGWTTQANTPVKNQDLWKYLLMELENCWLASGMRVQLWHISTVDNWVANRVAKEAVNERGETDFIHDIGPLSEL